MLSVGWVAHALEAYLRSRVCTETNFTVFSIRPFIKERLSNFSAMSISAALEGAHAGRLLIPCQRMEDAVENDGTVITTVVILTMRRFTVSKSGCCTYLLKRVNLPIRYYADEGLRL